MTSFEPSPQAFQVILQHLNEENKTLDELAKSNAKIPSLEKLAAILKTDLQKGLSDSKELNEHRVKVFGGNNDNNTGNGDNQDLQQIKKNNKNNSNSGILDLLVRFSHAFCHVSTSILLTVMCIVTFVLDAIRFESKKRTSSVDDHEQNATTNSSSSSSSSSFYRENKVLVEGSIVQLLLFLKAINACYAQTRQQQFKTQQHSLIRQQQLASTRTCVLRNGGKRVAVKTSDLLVGDVVVLTRSDSTFGFDGVIIECSNDFVVSETEPSSLDENDDDDNDENNNNNNKNEKTDKKTNNNEKSKTKKSISMKSGSAILEQKYVESGSALMLVLNCGNHTLKNIQQDEEEILEENNTSSNSNNENKKQPVVAGALLSETPTFGDGVVKQNLSPILFNISIISGILFFLYLLFVEIFLSTSSSSSSSRNQEEAEKGFSHNNINNKIETFLTALLNSLALAFFLLPDGICDSVLPTLAVTHQFLRNNIGIWCRSLNSLEKLACITHVLVESNETTPIFYQQGWCVKQVELFSSSKKQEKEQEQEEKLKTTTELLKEVCITTCIPSVRVQQQQQQKGEEILSGNQLDVALLNYSLSFDFDISEFKKEQRRLQQNNSLTIFPFSPQRNFMGCFLKNENKNNNRLILKGEVSSILPLCDKNFSLFEEKTGIHHDDDSSSSSKKNSPHYRKIMIAVADNIDGEITSIFGTLPLLTPLAIIHVGNSKIQFQDLKFCENVVKNYGISHSLFSLEDKKLEEVVGFPSSLKNTNTSEQLQKFVIDQKEKENEFVAVLATDQNAADSLSEADLALTVPESEESVKQVSSILIANTNSSENEKQKNALEILLESFVIVESMKEKQKHWVQSRYAVNVICGLIVIIFSIQQQQQQNTNSTISYFYFTPFSILILSMFVSVFFSLAGSMQTVPSSWKTKTFSSSTKRQKRTTTTTTTERKNESLSLLFQNSINILQTTLSIPDLVSKLVLVSSFCFTFSHNKNVDEMFLIMIILGMVQIFVTGAIAANYQAMSILILFGAVLGIILFSVLFLYFCATNNNNNNSVFGYF